MRAVMVVVTIRVCVLLLLLTLSTDIYSQSEGYHVQYKALDTGIYNPEKVVKNSFKVFYGDEAEKEFDKVLQEDEELKNLFVQTVIDDEGNSVSIREIEVSEYYPELGIIVESAGHGYISVFDIKSKKLVCGNPSTYAYSPSGKYRLSGLNADGMRYFLDEKINDEYVCLGSVHFNGTISAYYWLNDKTIYYLREHYKNDGSIYWVAYSGSFVLHND